MALLAAEQWGVVSLRELVACGVGREAISQRCQRGLLHPLHCGVYAVGHPNPPREGRLLAAVKACGPQAVLSHLSAGEVWGLTDPSDRYPEVTIPGTALRIHSGIRVHRTKLLDSGWRTTRQGIPVTTPTRTIIDLAAVLSLRELRRAVRKGQALHLIGLERLLDAMARLGSRRGTRNLRRVLATGPAPTRSVLEDVVLDLLLGAGFERPDVNVGLMVSGRTIIPDFRWAAQRLVVEADGAAWHDQRLAREDDAERQAVLEAAGERVIRVTWQQAIGDPQRTITRIRAAGAPPAHRVSNPSGQV